MGEDIHIKIIKRNKDTNNWEEILLFNKDNEKIPIYQERNYNMFDILKDLIIYPQVLVNVIVKDNRAKEANSICH